MNFLPLIAIVFLVISHVKGELRDILRLCEDGSCEMSEAEFARINSTVDYARRMYKLATAGVPQILWDRVAEVRTSGGDLGKEFEVSSKCADGLVQVSKGLDDMFEWAFRMIDASGKTPSNFFEATMTSMGSYDECLDISRETFSGQFCMPDIFATRVTRSGVTWPDPSRVERAISGKVNLGDISVFKGFAFMIGICVPSTCSADEVRSVLGTVLEPFWLKVNGANNCDTRESTSLYAKYASLTMHQIVAIAFISAVIGTISLATAHHAFLLTKHYLSHENFNVHPEPLVSALSLIDNLKQLTNANDKSPRNKILDFLKLGVILSGVCGHAIVSLEIPISYFVQESHSFFSYIFGSFHTQPITNEAGLIMVTFLGGVASYELLIPSARAGRLPYLFAIFDRWTRFVPSILCLTALEFIWPALWSGPLFARVADFTIKKCTRTWWHNLIFINNWFPVLDICAGHTYSTAVDFQLFILGLVAVFITVRSSRAGLCFSGLMIVLGLGRVSYNSYVYDTTASLYMPDPVPIKIVEYLDYIHMTTAVYIPSYFAGYIIGHLLSQGLRVKTDTYYDNIFWMIISNFFHVTVNVISGVYKNFRVFHSMSFLFVNLPRIFQTIGCAIMIVHYSSLNSIFGMKLNKSEDAAKEKVSGYRFSMMDMLCRLSYSIYMSNYMIIKAEFFTRRTLFEPDFYLTMKRVFSTTVLCILYSIIFQVLFISPFNNVRKILFHEKTVAVDEDKKGS